MLNDATLRKSIIASIIASLLVLIFIKPLLDIIWEFISWVSTYCYSGFNNAVFCNAALGQRDWVAVLHLELFISMLCGTLAGFSIVIFLVKHAESKIVERITKRRKIFRALIPILSVIMVFLSILILVIIRTDLQLNTSFKQRLTALSPHVSDLKIKELKASWAMMQDRKNYEEIIEEMENIAQKNGVQLPKLLIE